MLAKDCPRCHKTFGCLMTNIADCQCASLTIPSSLQAWLARHYQNCLCAQCLTTLVEIDRIAQIIPFSSDGKDLVMKYHYYIEDGKYVFTDLYHYQTDHCCGNRCRHCQYGKQPT